MLVALRRVLLEAYRLDLLEMIDYRKQPIYNVKASGTARSRLIRIGSQFSD